VCVCLCLFRSQNLGSFLSLGNKSNAGSMWIRDRIRFIDPGQIMKRKVWTQIK